MVLNKSVPYTNQYLENCVDVSYARYIHLFRKPPLYKTAFQVINAVLATWIIKAE